VCKLKLPLHERSRSRDVVLAGWVLGSVSGRRESRRRGRRPCLCRPPDAQQRRRPAGPETAEPRAQGCTGELKSQSRFVFVEALHDPRARE